MDTVALIKRIVRITNKFSSPNTILSKDELLKFVSQGFGGNTTALAVNIETAPTHIAGLPVAVNIGCHVTRHITKII